MNTTPSLSAFTFLRNGTQLGFPYLASIQSILPIVDEFIVVVGEGKDDTLSRIEALNSPKIRIIRTTWNEHMAERGFVYAQQKMIGQYACTGQWAFYLEGDEVVHEDDLPRIQHSLRQHQDNPEVEALLFDYLHFYGSPQWLAVSPRWYRRECRIIRNTIRSFAPDGQYWVVMERQRRGRYPRAALSGARMFHYGHVRRQAYMQEKLNQVSKYWSHAAPTVNYAQVDPQSLRPFQGSHPAVVQAWLNAEAEASFNPSALPDLPLSRRDRKHRLSMKLEQWFGWDLSHKHYRLVGS